MNLPKITVITPSYNQGQFLEDTIKSVILQKYPNLEYLIFDGGSTDNSVDIIKKYEKDITFWVSEKDKGQTNAINNGFKKATGDIIAWLNSDDFYYPGTLDIISRMYMENPDAGLYIGNGTVADINGNRLRKYSNDILFDYDVLLKGSNYILQPSTFINSKAVKELGYMDESLYYAMDLEYWLRIAQKFEVVTVNRELSAYRWYDQIKTKTGGIKRWVEQWNIMRKYSKAQITPGLLVEFFNVLKEPDVIADLGFNVENYAQENWLKFYSIMQKLLGTNDCIPSKTNSKVFQVSDSKVKGEKPVKAEAPQIIKSRGANLKIDIVMPEGHSWFVREGYAEALKHFNVFGRVFYVSDKRDNRELYDYLKNPDADMIFMMDTGWHAQYLHKTAEWRKRWNENNLKKILFSFECMNNPTIKGNNVWWKDNITAVDNAMNNADAVIYAHEIDDELYGKYGVPILWQPFAIDEQIFPEPAPYESRKKKAYFKGKTTPFYYEETYSKRRDIAQQLKGNDYCEIFESYDWKTNRQFIEEMNEYQVTLGLPSLSPTMVVRPFEAMASGCVFFQNQIVGEKSNLLFEEGKNILTYDENNIPALIDKIKYVIDNPEYGKAIAENGYKEVMEKHTIRHRVGELLDWFESNNNFTAAPESKRQAAPLELGSERKIAVDGVIFQMQKGRPYGISRVWISLLTEIAKSELARNIVILDRGGTAPKINGIRNILINEYDYIKFEGDSLSLEEVCRKQGIDLLVSTYFTYPENTHCVVMLHDMIPEMLGFDLTKPEWKAKLKAIAKANAFLCVSNNTLKDFRKLYSEYEHKKCYVVSNAVSDDFYPRSDSEIKEFKEKYNIQKPYFILVGNRLEYKNAILFFRAIANLENKFDFEIFCTGGKPVLEPIFAQYIKGMKCQIQYLNDSELAIAYSGAQALVYPSKYEGFGLPLLEAMRAGCPVITCRNSSIPEVVDGAALFVDENSSGEMLNALREIQKEDVRKELVKMGFVQSSRFSWAKTAEVLRTSLKEIVASHASVRLNSSDPLDTFERILYSLKTEAKYKDFYTGVEKLKNLFENRKFAGNKDFNDAEKIFVKLNKELFTALKELYTAGGTDGFADYLFACALYYSGNMAEALNVFISAVKNNLKHWRVTYLAGLAAEETGQVNEAKLLLQNSLQLNPNLNEAKKKLDLLNKLEREGGIVVSAIVATYNSEEFMDGCLKDLVEQSLYKNGGLEIIVVDTGSEQNEGKTVKKYQSKYKNIKYIRTENRETIYHAWNLGIQEARGEYITNANTDDRHKADALEIMAFNLDIHQDVDVVYADQFSTTVPNDTFSSATLKQNVKWSNFDKDLIHFGCFIGPQPMWRKNLHEQFGYFNDSLKVVGDFEFWLRISRDAKFLHLSETLGLYYYSKSSAEHRNQSLTDKEHKEVQYYYLGRNVKTGNDIDRIKDKLNSLSSIKEMEGYLKKAFAMLEQREKGIVFEESVIDFIRQGEKFSDREKMAKIEKFKEAIEKSELPVDSETYNELLNLYGGAIEFKNQNLEEARKFYEEALRINPASSGACTGLADIFYQSDLFEEAKTMYEWAIKNDPSNESAQNGLAEVNKLLNL